MSKVKLNLKDKVEDGEMDLSMCQLQDVPVREIATYKKVYSLDLSNNNLITLPKQFRTLTNLTKLDLSKNSIETLPQDFGSLKKLKHLDLYMNKLEMLPNSFGALVDLRWLDLKDNPLRPELKERAGDCSNMKECQQCAKKVVAYIAKIAAEQETEIAKRQEQSQKDKLVYEQQQAKLKQQEKKRQNRLAKLERERRRQEELLFARQPDLFFGNDVGNNWGAKPVPRNRKKRSSSCLRRLLTSLLFSVSAIFIVTAIDSEHTNALRIRIVRTYSDLVANLSPDYRPYEHLFVEYLGIAHRFVGQIVNTAIWRISEFVRSESVASVVETATHRAKLFLQSSQEFLRNLSR